MFGFGTYIYVSVCFSPEAKSYFYRTNDSSLQVGDLVIVPTENEEIVGAITAVNKYKKRSVPYPIDKTKLVIRKATKDDIEKNPALDMRVPMDISATSIKTEGGYKIVVLGQKDRDALKKQFAGKNVKLIEKHPVSMAGQVVREGKK